MYGLKYSSAAWKDLFSLFIKDVLGFKPTTMDPNVYMRKSVKTSNGSPYYEYLLVYVADVLVFSEKSDTVMEVIGKHFMLKDGFSQPEEFLGAGIQKKNLHDDDSGQWTAPSTSKTPSRQLRPY